MGAVVALEVARLMLEDGEEVAFLGLLDPIGERTGRAQHYWRRVRKEVEQRRLVRTVASSVSTRVGLRLGRVEPYEVTELHLAMIEAGQAYTPSPYPGAATLFRTIGYLSPASFWEALVTGGLQVEPPFTPVGHAYVEVAPQLALALERAGTTRHDRVVATTI
jgi:thioesterase domain-containing protein